MGSVNEAREAKILQYNKNQKPSRRKEEGSEGSAIP
jgi:hypothetical protein